ncbi:MAG: GntR family transcriptional regulator [Candidatus Dormibacteraeota bacterium]|uniref:GntR family transcriptional regulator n=1 Tax=Candidatus Amunia macphersoniae TaxID=3127014 RepID=A0A934KGI7_9BACT|nr:GntR family transcriptional regulator [Candidatus Dormibacteraeota bacterium]
MAAIAFRLDGRSGVPTYRQLTRQVHRALRLGVLERGDQLPTAREVVEALAINPNTVLRAYRDLEQQGLVQSRPGQGTFVVDVPPGPSLGDRQALRRGLERWVRDARRAGLDDEGIDTLVDVTLRDLASEEEIA